MAQQKQVSWTELRVGLFVLAGAVLLVLVIFYVTGSGGAIGPKYRLHTFLPEVDGLTVGAPVRVDGVEVGNVEKIVIAPLPLGQKEPTRSIEVDMRIRKSAQDYIRSDSKAGLITEGLLGNRYVDIDRGFVGRVLQNNEEIPGHEEEAIKEVVSRSADLLTNLSGITDQASEILDGIKKGRGSLGKLLVDEDAYNHLNAALSNVDQVTADVKAGKGTAGQLLTNDELYNKVNATVGQVKDVIGAVQNQQGTIGKLIYDPAVNDSAKRLIDNGNSVLADVRAGKGTLGKLATDDSLFLEYKSVGSNLATASAKLNDTTGSAGKFFSDPKFYDNLTGLTGDMRLLVGDFEKDPKKFLHIKLTIF